MFYACIYATPGLGFDSCCLQPSAAHPLTSSRDATAKYRHVTRWTLPLLQLNVRCFSSGSTYMKCSMWRPDGAYMQCSGTHDHQCLVVQHVRLPDIGDHVYRNTVPCMCCSNWPSHGALLVSGSRGKTKYSIRSGRVQYVICGILFVARKRYVSGHEYLCKT